MNSELTFREYWMFVGKKQDDDWYEWCVFVDDDRETLSHIVSVEYTLHPSFPNPIRRTRDRSIRFALFSSGWGGFLIGIDVEWTDGSHTRSHYMLKLDRLKLGANNWPTKAEPRTFEDPQTGAVYKALFHETFRWRKAETVARITGINERKVTEIFNQLSQEDLVRKADFLSFEKKELWAPTSTVGVLPRL